MPSPPLIPVVRPAEPENRDPAVGVLQAGFFADPLSLWLVSDDERRRRFHRGIFAAAFNDSLDKGALLIASIDETVAGIAVSPRHQGRGIGAALLESALERCDRSSEGTYLEATSPDNHRLYGHCGFKDRTSIDLPGGPHLHPMWRKPAPARSV